MQFQFLSSSTHVKALRQILLEASHSSDALKGLYAYLKKHDKKFSLPYICLKAGMSSTGYLSDVFRGRRTLHKKYKDAVVKVFPLDELASRYLKQLIAINAEKDPALKKKLARRLATTKKALSIHVGEGDRDVMRMAFAMEVFCTFGLFNSRPTFAELKRHYGAKRSDDLEQALVTLKDLKLITGDRQGYRTLTDQFLFSEDKVNFTHLDYVALGFQHAVANVSRWYPRKDLSHFECSMLSVKREAYEAMLVKLKQDFPIIRAKLESPDADMIIRFNIQIYPND